MKRGVSRLFLLAAIAYLLLGLALQMAHMADLWLGFNPLAYTAASVVLAILLVGWVTQAVMGLMYQTMVRPTRRSAIGWGCLNLGLVTMIAGQLLMVLTGTHMSGALLVAGGMLQLGAGAVFAADLASALRSRSVAGAGDQ